MGFFDNITNFFTGKKEPQSTPMPQTAVSSPTGPVGLSAPTSSVDAGMGGRRRRHRKTKKAGRRHRKTKAHRKH